MRASWCEDESKKRLLRLFKVGKILTFDWIQIGTTDANKGIALIALRFFFT